MPPVLDLRRLRYFRAIAEHGSFTAAARALRVAQPALSHHMAELESALGVGLFERSHRGVRVTAAGAVLLDHARRILVAAAEAERSMGGFRRDGSRATGSLHIAVITSVAAGLTPMLVAAVARELPGVALHITETMTRESRTMLAEGQADLAINLTLERNADIAPLVCEDMVLVTPPAARGVKSPPIRFGELDRHPLILPARGKPVRELVEAAAQAHGMSLRVVMEIDGLGPRLRATMGGLGATVTAPFHVVGELEAGLVSVRPIVDPPLTREIVLERRPGLDPAIARRLRPLLVGLLRDLLGGHGYLAPCRAEPAEA